MKNKHRTVIINIGGGDYRSKITNFSKFPASRLGKIVRASTTKEILKLCDGYIPGSPPILYFDKNDQNFSSILDIYRMNELHVCGQNCALVTQEDLAFWGIDELAMEPCCALKSQMGKDVLRLFKGVKNTWLQKFHIEFSIEVFHVNWLYYLPVKACQCKSEKCFGSGTLD